MDTTTVTTKGRLTNQLQYLKNAHRIIWRHHYAWPFHKPVDPVALNIPVRLYVYIERGGREEKEREKKNIRKKASTWNDIYICTRLLHTFV